jgi:D-galactose 1-dehydrogenase
VTIDAVAICTPPQQHYEAAKLALARGKHVLLEKPPCTSLAQLDHLVALARAAGRTLYPTWHSRHAPGVAPAARLLQQRQFRRVHVAWKEDVRRWHPGQTWIWQAGGFGVLDPGINAFSILTQIIAEPLFAQTAALLFVPSNCEAPIAADIEFTSASGVAVTVELDFRHTGTQTWTIDLDTDTGPIKLSAGGSLLSVANERVGPDGQRARERIRVDLSSLCRTDRKRAVRGRRTAVAACGRCVHGRKTHPGRAFRHEGPE